MPGAVYLDIGGTYRINEHALAYFKIAESTALNPGIRKFPFGILAEEQYSTYGRHQLVVMLRDRV